MNYEQLASFEPALAEFLEKVRHCFKRDKSFSYLQKYLLGGMAGGWWFLMDSGAGVEIGVDWVCSCGVLGVIFFHNGLLYMSLRSLEHPANRL